MLAAALLGLLQGLAEWLPVSSEGVVTTVSTLVLERSLSEAVTFALWLHLGTAVSALIALRSDVLRLLRELLATRWPLSPFLRYLILATVVSGILRFLLLLSLEEVSALLGASAMLVVGVLTLVTGGILLRRRVTGSRTRHDVSTTDAVLAGLAQGLAVLPGLSRSGLTVAVLLGRRVDRSDALVLSFLMSIPASVGAALYAGLDAGLAFSGEALAAAAVAAVVGLVTIRALLAVARRVNFGLFVLLLGVVILGGALWNMLAG